MSNHEQPTPGAPDAQSAAEPTSSNSPFGYVHDLWRDQTVRVVLLILGLIAVILIMTASLIAGIRTVSMVVGGKHQFNAGQQRGGIGPQGNEDSPWSPGRGLRGQRGDQETPGNPGQNSGPGGQLPNRSGVPSLGGDATGGLGMLGQSLQHGDVVVQPPGQASSTKRFVKGTVTALANNVVTVKATDGYSSPFTLTSTTVFSSGDRASVAKGTSVFVLGTVSGKTVTADLVRFNS